MTTTAPTRLFRRAVRVVVGTTEIKDLDMTFRVERSLTPTPNKAEVTIWGLSPDRRAELQAQPIQPVLIEAGYEQGTSILFVGYMRTARSWLDGPAAAITLAVGDGEAAISRARISSALRPGTPSDVALRLLVQALGVAPGNTEEAVRTIKASPIASTFDDGTVLFGTPAEEMNRLTRAAGMTWSVQDGRLQFLPLGAALGGEAIVVDMYTGLVDAPSVDNNGVLSFRMLMAPDVFPGRLVVIESRFVKGQYRLEKTVHSGSTASTEWFVDAEAKRY